MIDLIALRDLGDRDGGEIFSPILSSVEAALQRGRYEIDFNAPTIRVNLSIDYAPNMRFGDQVTATDVFTGETAYGVLMGLSHVREGPALYTNIDLEVAP